MPEIATPPLLLAAVALAAYLLGAIPFGLVMARAFGLGDLRKIGSGNIGATNVLRTGNRTAAALTLLLDAGKGGIAALAAGLALGPGAAQLAGFAAFLGHLYPIYLRFGGGKGVATALGSVLAVAWPAALACAVVWIAVARLTRYSSLAALVAAASGPLWMLAFGYGDATIFATAVAAFIFLAHSGNIVRLLAGREPRIGDRATARYAADRQDAPPGGGS
jgi:glycerol-3-phosphate acyltransferase PlsY